MQTGESDSGQPKAKRESPSDECGIMIVNEFDPWSKEFYLWCPYAA